ncbi:MAG: hypothetical protein AB7N24_16840 [Dehalococcoidia bacterium]
MTATLQAQSANRSRPTTLVGAVALSIFYGVAPIPLLPTINDADSFVVGVTIAFAVLFVLGAWGIWVKSKWAAIATFVFSAINAVLAFGSIFTAPSGSPDAFERFLGVAGVVLALVLCALIAARSTREALR